jgi:hypothetical protein
MLFFRYELTEVLLILTEFGNCTYLRELSMAKSVLKNSVTCEFVFACN